MTSRRWGLVALLFVCVLFSQAQTPTEKPPFQIGKAELQERIAKLEVARDQAIANVNALSGAIQECTYWLERIENEEARAKKAKEKPPKPEEPKKEPPKQ